MRSPFVVRPTLLLSIAAALFAPWTAMAESATADDRIALSADGSTLTGTNGGAGASLGWLHNFDAASLAGVAVEHQVLSTAHWTFGSINGSLTRGPDGQRYSVYGEAHEGTGDDGPHSFRYAIESAGVIGTYFHRLSAQLEDREINVDNIHGNLPKAALSYLWSPHLLTSASYSYSVRGNLGTRLTAVRIDEYNATVNLLAGVAFGQVSPIVVGIVSNQAVVLAAGHRLKEGYVGMSKPLQHLRSEIALVADYQDVSGSKRFTLTLSYIFRVGRAGTAR
ncbi:MAG: hypothetical protein M3N50_07575 [Pseudomonadota bacterium]|nr:hypothetical protein [Pseudomonadota bacterium]